MNSSRARVVVAWFALVALVSTPAGAQPEPGNLEEAQAAYTRGMDLRAAGDLAGATEALHRADTLHPTPITGLELGRTLLLLGKQVQAREALLAVSRLPPRPNESVRATTARQEAASLAQSLGERIPVLHFRRGPVGAAPTVRLDGAVLETLDAPRRVDPGEHVLEILRGEPHRASEIRRVTLREGESTWIDLPVLLPVAEVASGPNEAASPPPDRTLFWVGLGFTAAAASLGSAAGLVALGDASSARPGCPDNRCQPSVRGTADAAQTWATVSTVSFVVAAALGVATVTAWLLPRPARATLPVAATSWGVTF